MPAHVARGKIAQTTPEATAALRDDELFAQHHHARRGAADRKTAWRAGPELRGRENVKPAVHEQVVQALDDVDVAQHLPQLMQRTTV